MQRRGGVRMAGGGVAVAVGSTGAIGASGGSCVPLGVGEGVAAALLSA